MIKRIVRKLRDVTHNDVVASPRKTDEPRIIMVTHSLTNDGGPLVFLDVMNSYIETFGKNNLVIANPKGNVPDPTFWDKITAFDIPHYEIFPGSSSNFEKGDVVFLNTACYPPWFYKIILDNIESGIIKKLYIYAHEYLVEDTFDVEFEPTDLDKNADVLIQPKNLKSEMIKHMKSGVIEIFLEAKQIHRKYQEYFGLPDSIKLVKYKLNLGEFSDRNVPENIFNEINFLSTYPDPRKGVLDTILAFIAYYKNYYEKNPQLYRKAVLHVMGVDKGIGGMGYTRRVLDYIKNYPEILKGYESLSEEEWQKIANKCNVTVADSTYEGLPRTVFYGMSVGHPIIRDGSSGVEEQLIEGENGWRINSNNFWDLVEVFEELLNTSRISNSLLSAMGDKSKAIVAKNLGNNFDELITSLHSSYYE